MRGGNSPLAAELGGGAPAENVQNIGAFSCNLGTPQLYFKDSTFPLI